MVGASSKEEQEVSHIYTPQKRIMHIALVYIGGPKRASEQIPTSIRSDTYVAQFQFCARKLVGDTLLPRVKLFNKYAALVQPWTQSEVKMILAKKQKSLKGRKKNDELAVKLGSAKRNVPGKGL